MDRSWARKKMSMSSANWLSRFLISPIVTPSMSVLSLSIIAKISAIIKKYKLKQHPPIFFFFLKFLADTCPFLGPLVPLFWISGDVFSGFQSQSGLPYSRSGGKLNGCSPRSTSGATLASCPPILLQR